MTEGSKNTVLGVVLTALLAGVVWIITSTQDHGNHLARLDTVMLQNADILKDIHNRLGIVPMEVEGKLAELRNRMNLQESRINTIDTIIVGTSKDVGYLKDRVLK